MSLIPKKLEKGFEALLSPLVDLLIARHVSPNALTTVGTLVLLGSGVAFGMAQVRLGAVLLLLSGVFDMLDGRVARGGEVASKFGAFYDSTLDRVGEAALYTGIAIFFMTGGVPGWLAIPAVVIAVSALSFSLVVSYARARAEGLGLDCKVGIGQRAERILGLGAPVLFFGAGPSGFLLLGIVSFLAVLAFITVIQRIHHVYKLTRKKRRVTRVGRVTPALADFTAEYQGKGK
ncbi:MAG: CDP-alcohol phosphatidyltransferase family protein [Gemmatimonadota bacterium]|nr:MAG: CDP-alcohol phosphatidyltransferase family protein [Gemmatimonadota bacterium]